MYKSGLNMYIVYVSIHVNNVYLGGVDYTMTASFAINLEYMSPCFCV